MDAHQQALLQSTHDSTIRQEGVINTIQLQLNDGQRRFQAIDQRFTVVEGDILSIKQVTEPTRKARKTFGKVVWLLVAAISYPAAAWIWETLSKLKKGP